MMVSQSTNECDAISIYAMVVTDEYGWLWLRYKYYSTYCKKLIMGFGPRLPGSSSLVFLLHGSDVDITYCKKLIMGFGPRLPGNSSPVFLFVVVLRCTSISECS